MEEENQNIKNKKWLVPLAEDFLFTKKDETLCNELSVLFLLHMGILFSVKLPSFWYSYYSIVRTNKMEISGIWKLS